MDAKDLIKFLSNLSECDQEKDIEIGMEYYIDAGHGEYQVEEVFNNFSECSISIEENRIFFRFVK